MAELVNQELEISSMNTTVHELCDDILVHIFSYLDTDHLIMNVYEVCDRWKELIGNDTMIWRKRWLVCNIAKPVTTLCNSLHRVPLLKRLRFCAIFNYGYKIQMRGFCANAAKEILREVPQLRMLEYDIIIARGNILSRHDITDIYDHYYSLAQLKSLETLKMESAYDFYGTHFRMIADQCDKLKHLHLPKSRGPNTSDVMYFLEKKKTQIETLELSGYALTDEAYLAIIQCTNLQVLRIHYARRMSFSTLYKIVHSHIKVVQLCGLKFQYEVPTSVRTGRVIELVMYEGEME